MQITITSTLTEEQALMLAKEKGWQETIVIQVPSVETKVVTMPVIAGIEPMEYTVPVSYTEQSVPNTTTCFDFLKAVYENMIKDDAKTLFIRIDDRLNVDKKIAREQLLKDMVDASFL